MSGGYGSAFHGKGKITPIPKQGGFGSLYNGQVASQGKPKAKSHSFLGSLIRDIPGSHIVGQTMSDLESAALHMPAGLYDVGKGVTKDVGHAAHGDFSFKQSRAIGKAVAQSTLQDLEHPLRHPGYTLLDLSGIAGGIGGVAGRVGAVGKVMEEASAAGKAAQLGDIAKAAIKRPMPPTRYIGGEQALYSRNTAFRQAQKLVDMARERWPEAFRAASTAGKQAVENRRVTEATGRFPAETLAAIGKKLSKSQQVALRVVAEGKTVDERIQFHKDQMAAGEGSKMGHRLQIKLLQNAAPFIKDVNGKPTLADEHLQKVYNTAKSVAHDREQLLQELGFLPGDITAGRVHAPGQAIEGSLEKVHALQDALAKDGTDAHIADLAPEVFAGGDFRVPYATRAAMRSLGRLPGYSGAIPNVPGTIAHRFLASLLKGGVFRNDTTNLLAESYLEAQRFHALRAARDTFLNEAQDTPEGIPAKFRQAIRMDSLKGKNMPAAVRDFLNRPHGESIRDVPSETHPAEWRFYGHAYEALRGQLFPKEQDLIGAEKGIKWIDKRRLGGLEKSNPLVGANQWGATRKALTLADSINNASRLAILYLKPAYFVPNALGNVALNFLQQGFAAPINIGRAVFLSHELGPDAALIDHVMGEGFTAALTQEGTHGLVHAATSKAANIWQKGVDTPFRRSSFLYEAQQAGFKTAEQIRELLHNQELQPKLIDVARRANREIIDYADLNPVEREIIRRVIFFYPWVKGSTLYAAHFMADHPLKAAGVAQLGKRGAAEQKQQLGELPSYAEDIFKVGGSAARPNVIEPASATLFSTPADVIQAFREAVGGNTTAAHNLATFLSPVGAAELAAMSRQSQSGKTYPPGVSPLDIFGKELIQGTPQSLLYQRIAHPRRNALYPYSSKQAVEQFIAGGVVPRPMNRARATELARKEKKGR